MRRVKVFLDRGAGVYGDTQLRDILLRLDEMEQIDFRSDGRDGCDVVIADEESSADGALTELIRRLGPLTVARAFELIIEDAGDSDIVPHLRRLMLSAPGAAVAVGTTLDPSLEAQLVADRAMLQQTDEQWAAEHPPLAEEEEVFFGSRGQVRMTIGRTADGEPYVRRHAFATVIPPVDTPDGGRTGPISLVLDANGWHLEEIDMGDD